VTRSAALLALLASCAAPEGELDVEPDWSRVQTELAMRVEQDQALRRAVMVPGAMTPELVDRVVAVDHENTAWMKELVTRHGWPTFAAVGEEGAANAWLLVQHADQDVDFQEQCLELLRATVEQGQASRTHLAYLEDRVAMHRGRPQRYGTQFVNESGGLKPYRLEDPARVDQWRAEVGLGTLAEYEELLRSQ
jgi:hypothetical protein